MLKGGPHLIIPAVAFPEVQDEPLQNELANLRELGVDDGHNSRVDVGEDGGGTLGLENGPGQETPTEPHNNHTLVRHSFLNGLSEAKQTPSFQGVQESNPSAQCMHT